jgi:hypothetical protein
MKIPFTIDQFMHLFETYNLSVWPVQWIAYLLGGTALLLILTGLKDSPSQATGNLPGKAFGLFLIRSLTPQQAAGLASAFPFKRSHQLVAAILSFMWIWNGAVYHIGFFSGINKAAYLFGVLFVIQGMLLLWQGVYKSNLHFVPRKNLQTAIGAVFILYAMGIYPLLNHLLGHAWPQQPMFGIAPCPTTIFTFGLLLLSDARFPKFLLIVPFLWSLVGMSAAVSLNISADYGLFATGIIAAGTMILQGRKIKAMAPAAK